ncbi:hypothetical protein M413DRAFT_267492 [Hebeloma cylindrosporum]|uniref:Uncharacterized protein n=1 Tax=Hebeloma cylindrosporum TaxID=76867 RepID=A0A0C2Z1D8_HEBCY|nr:hypothetical protein M413DRAFT_267492 [Hebeloma cylindrosporum h7]
MRPFHLFFISFPSHFPLSVSLICINHHPLLILLRIDLCFIYRTLLLYTTLIYFDYCYCMLSFQAV